MQFQTVVDHFLLLESTQSRLETTKHLKDLLERTPNSAMERLVYLLQGKVGPEWKPLEFGLADKLIVRALAHASGREDVEAQAKEIGDLGEVAKVLFQTSSGRQGSLFGPEPLTLDRVYNDLYELTQISGKGSQEEKQRVLTRLLLDAKPDESRFIVRMIQAKLRLGVKDMTILEALTFLHLGLNVTSVTEMDEATRSLVEQTKVRLERSYDFCSDLARVAKTLVHGGIKAVDAIDVEVGIPLRAMAAERLQSLEEILEKHEGQSAVEYKYDGLRVQAHVKKHGGTKLYSRRLEDLTEQFPDAVAFLESQIQVDEAIVEGECIAIDLDTGRLRPFQDTSRRRGRKTGLGEAGSPDMTQEIPVAVFLFDLLHSAGTTTMEESYEERRRRLEANFEFNERVQLSTMVLAKDVGHMEIQFQQAVQDGAEGVMCKHLQGKYKAGNRGFDWIKFKTDYTAELVDTMDLVVIGAFMGRGRRAGWYGALLMATYDPETESYQSLCKLGTGFDDATLMSLRGRFEHAVSLTKPTNVDSGLEPDVWFHPEFVMEVEAAEITSSPTHRAAMGAVREGQGLAARFPRFTGRWRDDKTPELATKSSEIVDLYHQQLARHTKGRS